VVSFLNREEVFETQTPQISDLNAFVKAIKHVETLNDSSLSKTNKKLPRDEAELLTKIGEKIFVYECCPSNRKVTYESDFSVKLENNINTLNDNYRIGVGIDSHRFTEKFNKNKPVILGGVDFSKSRKTFKANSDGDVILHSICNALLSTIGEKTLDEFADKICKSGITNSAKYLEKTFEIIYEKYSKFKIINVVFSLECKYPKLAKQHDRIISSLAKLLKILPEKIGLNYTTGEKLTSFGRGEGVYCLCNIFVQLN
jgi:2-C-methyl-D-erythritol 2,4-cyclodiphosphate synthase